MSAGRGVWTAVLNVASCDLSAKHGAAFADASLPKQGGRWGYVCLGCFVANEAALGLGRGQMLVRRGREREDLVAAIGQLQASRPKTARTTLAALQTALERLGQ